MLRHNVKHFGDVFVSFLFLDDAVDFELLDKLLLVVFVDIRNLLSRQLVLILTFDAPVYDLVRIGEPDCSVVVLEELALHAKNFNVMQLRNEVSHLVALLEAVFKLICLNQLDVFAEGLVTVLDFGTCVAHVHRSVKLDDDRLSDPPFRLDTRLHAVVHPSFVHALI